MQLHPGSIRNHNRQVYEKFGRDKGADIPSPTEYVRNLRPLLSKYGNDPRLTFILFTLDETSYSRELAPLAGHYPALQPGPAVVVPRFARGHDALPRDRPPRPPASTTRSASTTIRAPSSRFPPVTTWRAGSTARSLAAWSRSIGSTRTRPSKWSRT